MRNDGIDKRDGRVLHVSEESLLGVAQGCGYFVIAKSLNPARILIRELLDLEIIMP